MSKFEIILRNFSLTKRDSRKIKKTIKRTEHEDKKTKIIKPHDSTQGGRN